MSTERASIHVVAGQPPGGVTAPQPFVTAPEPEAPQAAPLPPLAPPPGEDLPPAVGGPTMPSPAPEDRVEAAGGGVAERLRARFEAIASTEEFPVPGWELPDGRPGLILVARAFGDRKAFNAGVSNEVFIAKSTHRLLFVEDNGQRQEIAGGWGPTLAGMIGVDVSKAADLVALVISKPDPAEPSRRIPNVAGIGSLTTDLIEWSKKATREAEDDLGQ